MPKKRPVKLNINLAEIAKVLCPRCTEKVKQLVGQKLAEQAMGE